MLRGWYGSAACIDGSSLCDFFELLNRKGDLGDFGDFTLKGDRGESMKSCSCSRCSSSAAAEETPSVSGCGMDFRVMMPLFAARGVFRLAAAQVAGLLNASCAQPSGT